MRSLRKLEPASRILLQEGQFSSNAQQEKLVRDPPVVPESQMRLYPDEAAPKLEAPGLHHAARFEQKCVRRLEMKMSLGGDDIADGKVENLVD